MTSSMATSTSVCAVCDLQHKTTQSSHWCIECEEPLCTACTEHHNVLKATRSHKTIPISDYQLLPSAVTDIKQHCIYHNEKYQLYCIKHESPMCNKCVKDHGKCGEILSLDELVKDIKTSESFVDLEQSLNDLLDNIIQIHKDRESNIESITDRKKKIAAEVCHLKKQVIQHVNKLEEEFIKDLDQIESTCCNTIRSIASSLQDQAQKINQMKSEIKNTKNYASDLQTFLSMREIQAKTIEYEKHLQSSIDEKKYEQIDIENAIDTNIQDILTLDIFGSIKVKKYPSSNITLKRMKDRHAQMMVPKPRKSINDIKLEFKRKLDTTCTYPYGCCATKKGEFLFTNYESNNGKLIVINAEVENYTVLLKETYRAYDVAPLDDSTVAVSTGYSSKQLGISIVDLTKRKVIKVIDLKNYPYGISYDGKALICCVGDKDLHVISCTDNSITTIPNSFSPRYSYVSTHADKIFLTNPDKHIVTCSLYSGVQMWEFKDENVLSNPRGITIDNKGNVFVVGMGSCNVVVISPDGKHCKQILTEEDGLNRPTSIYFDKERKQLLVTNHKQFVYIYEVSYH